MDGPCWVDGSQMMQIGRVQYKLLKFESQTQAVADTSLDKECKVTNPHEVSCLFSKAILHLLARNVTVNHKLPF